VSSSPWLASHQRADIRSKALRDAMNRSPVRGGHIHPRDGCELLLTQSKRYQGMRGREWVFDLVVNL
jgi:hypothetical protein